MSYAFFGCVSSYWRTFFICKKLAEVKQLLPEANRKLCIPLIGRVNFTQKRAQKYVAKQNNGLFEIARFRLSKKPASQSAGLKFLRKHI